MSFRPTAPDPPFGRIAIVGLGVMGGSLARALAALPKAPVVTGWSREMADAREALGCGAIASSGPVDAPDARAAALARADLVVLAAPLAASVDLLDVVAREAPETATVTDVASLKRPLAEATRAAGLGDRWVGAHPMTGSEASGFGAARADLYADARVWIVPGDAEPDRVGRVERLWRELGARPETIEAEAHDRMMALVSHLPQLASNALAEVLVDAGIASEALGPGGRDATRLAGSSPEMWGDLIRHASPELIAALRALAAAAGRFADRIESRDVTGVIEVMERTTRWKGGG